MSEDTKEERPAPLAVPGVATEQSGTGAHTLANVTPGEMKRLLRQEEVFRRRIIERQTVRQVAEEMGLCLQTVVDDCKAELKRRADELAAQRETEKAAQLAMVEDLYLTAKQDRSVPGSGAYGAASKALEMRARLLGLDAPTKIEVGVQSLLEALDGGSQEA